jgi:hypothetical protein
MLRFHVSHVLAHWIPRNQETRGFQQLDFMILLAIMRSRSPEPATPVLPRADQCAPEDVRAQLERVLDSPRFRSSRRCQNLLRHITERALAGDVASLKERTLGVEVFGRAADYDTNADPVVRGTAGEIRKKLAQYYQGSSHNAEILIALHPGSYIPEFSLPEPVSAAPAPRPYKRIALLIGAVALVLAAIAATLLVSRSRNTEMDRFWRPMLDAPGSVLICLGQPRVYGFRSNARQQEIETAIQGMPPADLPNAHQPITLGELVPLWDRYIGLGDAKCLLRVASVLEKSGKLYRVRGGESTTFSDLREGPAILIGAFDNEWTLRAVGMMRYTFYRDLNKGLEVVRDRLHLENNDWQVVNAWPERKISNDYAIVSRVLDVQTNHRMMIAAGITEYGTAGAGEFLADPKYFAEVVPKLPLDWPTRNLQIVLRVPVVEGAAGPPQVVATHVW